MRYSVLALSIVLPLLAGTGPSTAQNLPTTAAYCLVTDDGDGGSMLQCAYGTRAQCLASKVANHDTCIPNPLRPR
jgi:hypothetical protein